MVLFCFYFSKLKTTQTIVICREGLAQPWEMVWSTCRYRTLADTGLYIYSIWLYFCCDKSIAHARVYLSRGWTTCVMYIFGSSPGSIASYLKVIKACAETIWTSDVVCLVIQWRKWYMYVQTPSEGTDVWCCTVMSDRRWCQYVSCRRKLLVKSPSVILRVSGRKPLHRGSKSVNVNGLE